MFMENKYDDVLGYVTGYYDDKILKNGIGAKGVDWKDAEGQVLRFEQLCKIITKPDFSINDIGCGYGAFSDYLGTHYGSIIYTGTDISKEMIAAAEKYCAKRAGHSFHVGSEPPQRADYSCASGIFNVRGEFSDASWLNYIYEMLDVLHGSSRLGFSFNCLTSYSDTDKMKSTLYYANPSGLFDYCKNRFSKQVALLHDYGLYEFTILVRTQLD